MTRRRDICAAWSLRLVLAGLVFLFGFVSSAFAQTLLPGGFFDNLAVSGTGQAAIEADMLSYDASTDVITAEGDVVMVYEGYTLRADRIVYRQRTGEVTADGNIEVVDTRGNRFVGEHVDITGGFQKAFVRSLIFTTADGSMITADEADFDAEMEIVLNGSTYSPCGLCIDSKGRRIGWRVRADQMVYVRDKGTIEASSASLELLGIPMAWVPWISIPDPSQPRKSGFRVPRADYSEKMGLVAELPYFWAVDDNTDVLLIPRLMSRQGALFGVEVTHRFKRGSVDFRASGVYQLDPSAFAGTVGDVRWRGAIQTSGHFTPYADWAAGWSYTKFTDAAYLVDYELTNSKNSVNEVYVTHLSRDTFLDLRVQEFNLLGNVTAQRQAENARAIPNAKGEHIVDLAGGWGQVRLNGTLLGVHRGADQLGTYGGVNYIYGFEGTKYHGTAEASWQKQLIAPGGVAVTPFLGVRLDAAHYDGASALLPGDVSLLTATPIAALDVRWPLIAFNNGNSHLFEPIAQLVYRASDTTLPGITNDNAQSFTFDDSNLFSYDRFSGTDRQETGLRANLGGRYLASFDGGNWLELVAGQSFFLAGTNGLGIADPTQTGLVTGLGEDASYIILASRGKLGNVRGNTKLQLDPNLGAPRIQRFEAQADWWTANRFSIAAGYFYLAADPRIGVAFDRHEASATVGFPLADYWTGTTGLAWDLAGNNWLDVWGGVLYDDKYLSFGVNAGMTGPAHTSPYDFRISATFKLRGPAGEFAF